MLKEKVLKFNERNKLFAKGDRIVCGGVRRKRFGMSAGYIEPM